MQYQNQLKILIQPYVYFVKFWYITCILCVYWTADVINIACQDHDMDLNFWQHIPEIDKPFGVIMRNM